MCKIKIKPLSGLTCPCPGGVVWCNRYVLMTYTVGNPF